MISLKMSRRLYEREYKPKRMEPEDNSDMSQVTIIKKARKNLAFFLSLAPQRGPIWALGDDGSVVMWNRQEFCSSFKQAKNLVEIPYYLYYVCIYVECGLACCGNVKDLNPCQ